MADSRTEPKIDGVPVTLEIDDTQLRWTNIEARGSNADGSNILLENIIAAVPSLKANEHIVLYTAGGNAAEDGDTDPALSFKSAVLTDLPKRFIDGQSPSDHGLLQNSAGNTKWQRINIVVSTGSGTGLASAVWSRLLQPLLESLGFTAERYAVHVTTSTESVMELTRSTILPVANEGIDQLVILLSGDGGVVDIVNTLLSEERSSAYKRPTLALLPLGTGNAMANSAVVGKDNTMGLRTLLHGTPRKLPLFRATFSAGAKLLVNEGREEQELQSVSEDKPVAYGAVVCSWGLHAALVADSDTAEYRKFGAERFKMAANEALFPSDGSLPHAYRGAVSILRSGFSEWQKAARTEHGYILATLVSHLEAGFCISPHSRPLDGELRLIHFGHVSGKEAMKIMTEAYQGGKHIEDDQLGYEDIRGLKIHFEEDDGRWRRVCIDGKIIRVDKGGWVEVMKEEESVVDLIARTD